MPQKIFVNLPVRDLKKSMDFFGKLGFTFNAQFADETAACMTISEDIFVMLLTENKFKTFTPKRICDATKSSEVLVCLSSATALRTIALTSSRLDAHMGIGLHGAERNQVRVTSNGDRPLMVA